MRDSIKTPLRVFLSARAASSVAALLALGSFPMGPFTPQQGYGKPGYSKLFELFFGVWERADGIWYLSIAHGGYVNPASRAFLPLYPFLVRVVDHLTPFPPIVAALVVSNLAFLVALHFIYRIARHELRDPDKASRALAYLAFYPGALFFFAPYTESLFLCLAAGSLCYARERKWARAAVLGMFLGLTRNLGLPAISAALGIEFLLQRMGSGSRPPWRQAGWLFLLPLGLVAWIWACHAETGDALAFIHQQSQWQRAGLTPWTTVAIGIKQAWDYCLAYPGGGYVFEAIAVSGAFALLTIGVLRRIVSAPLLVFAVLTLIPGLLAPYGGRTLMSSTRFVAVCFPVFLIWAGLVKRESTDQLVRACLTVAYGIAVAMYVANQQMF